MNLFVNLGVYIDKDLLNILYLFLNFYINLKQYFVI